MNNPQEGSIHVMNKRYDTLHILQVPPDHELYRLFINLSNYVHSLRAYGEHSA